MSNKGWSRWLVVAMLILPACGSVGEATTVAAAIEAGVSAGDQNTTPAPETTPGGTTSSSAGGNDTTSLTTTGGGSANTTTTTTGGAATTTGGTTSGTTTSGTTTSGQSTAGSTTAGSTTGGSTTGSSACAETWTTYASGFFTSHCTSCHSSMSSYQVVAAGANEERSAISERAMPLGATLSTEDYNKILDWFDCTPATPE